MNKGGLIFKAFKRSFLLFLIIGLVAFIVFALVGLTKFNGHCGEGSPLGFRSQPSKSCTWLEAFLVDYLGETLMTCFWATVIFSKYLIPLFIGLVCTFYFLDKSDQKVSS